MQPISECLSCILLLCWINLLDLVVFVWSPEGFLYIVSCHLHIGTVLPLPFQFGYLLFLFLVWLLWLGLPILCWVEVVRVAILVLFQILMGSLSAFHHWVLYWLWVCHNGFYYVEIYSLYTHFGKSFYREWIRCVYVDECKILFLYSSFYHYIMSIFIFLYGLYFKVYFVWYEYCSSRFLFISVCMKYLFPSPHFQSMCPFL